MLPPDERRENGETMNVNLGSADAGIGVALTVITDYLGELSRIGRLPSVQESDRTIGGEPFHVPEHFGGMDADEDGGTKVATTTTKNDQTRRREGTTQPSRHGTARTRDRS